MRTILQLCAMRIAASFIMYLVLSFGREEVILC